MSKTKYGACNSKQISSIKRQLQKDIFYLLLYVDPKEQIKFQHVDVNKAFDNVFAQLVGFNKILFEPPEILQTMNLLESARTLYNSVDFSFSRYRKLILDAGSKIMQVKEGDG